MFTQFELPNYFPSHWTQRHDPQTLVQQLQTNNVNVGGGEEQFLRFIFQIDLCYGCEIKGENTKNSVE